ncbi:hypothetical protein KM043_003417 [Ampulex compressa]|nr:hypothetical protein KM043_003417 [Ampulex compressa]
MPVCWFNFANRWTTNGTRPSTERFSRLAGTTRPFPRTRDISRIHPASYPLAYFHGLVGRTTASGNALLLAAQRPRTMRLGYRPFQSCARRKRESGALMDFGEIVGEGNWISVVPMEGVGMG